MRSFSADSFGSATNVLGRPNVARSYLVDEVPIWLRISERQFLELAGRALDSALPVYCLLSVIQPHRTQNRRKGILIVPVFFRRTNGNHIKQLAVTQLRCHDMHQLSLPSSFIDVVKRDDLTRTSVDVYALISTARLQVTTLL